MTPPSPSIPGFMSSSPQAPKDPPKEGDEAVQDAVRKQLIVERGFKGRGSTLLAAASEPDPARRSGSRLLGNFGALG